MVGMNTNQYQICSGHHKTDASVLAHVLKGSAAAERDDVMKSLNKRLDEKTAECKQLIEKFGSLDNSIRELSAVIKKLLEKMPS